jgi:hypothetical protein
VKTDKTNRDVSKELEKSLRSGALNRRAQKLVFAQGDFTFVSSLRGAEFVDKLFKDGQRVTGRLVNGHFEAVD